MTNMNAYAISHKDEAISVWNSELGLCMLVIESTSVCNNLTYMASQFLLYATTAENEVVSLNILSLKVQSDQHQKVFIMRDRTSLSMCSHSPAQHVEAAHASTFISHWCHDQLRTSNALLVYSFSCFLSGSAELFHGKYVLENDFAGIGSGKRIRHATDLELNKKVSIQFHDDPEEYQTEIEG